MRDFLVYTSAGENAAVKRWAKNPHRCYDIWVTNYSNTSGLWYECADFYNECKGAKFPNFKAVLERHYDHLATYKAIMIADDDIIISSANLDNLFHLFNEKSAALVVPAFSRFGKVSHDTTARELGSDYRYTNFAEVTCPIIRTDLLLDFMSVYDSELAQCYGVDWWYLSHWGDKVKHRIIISDTNYCINPRDWFKCGDIREIDRHYSEAERYARWDKTRQKMMVGNFQKEVFFRHPKSLVMLLRHLPIYVAEVVFAWLLDGRLRHIFIPLKPIFKRIAGK